MDLLSDLFVLGLICPFCESLQTAVAGYCNALQQRENNMSYDLMVFAPEAAPDTYTAFLEWYKQQCTWTEAHSYDNPKVATPQLQAWFMDMIISFPAMNGPYALPDDGGDYQRMMTEYSIGAFSIYTCFPWPQEIQAYRTAFHLAQVHRLGFFSASSNEGEVWLPGSDGMLVCTYTK